MFSHSNEFDECPPRQHPRHQDVPDERQEEGQEHDNEPDSV